MLTNLVLGENVIPEFIQADCTPENLADALLPLLADTPERRRQQEAFARLDDLMRIGDEHPSERAARIVGQVMAGVKRDMKKGPCGPSSRIGRHASSSDATHPAMRPSRSRALASPT